MRTTGSDADAAAIRNIAESVRNNELVAVIGSGVSLALTSGEIPALGWRGLIRDGFAQAVRLRRMNESQERHWTAQLDSPDMDELLLAAEFMGRKLDAPTGDLYARWLRNCFEQVSPTHQGMMSAINAIKSAGVPLCTLNYDSLLESVTELPTVRLSDGLRVNEWMRRHKGGILHLHGSWDDPRNCILGIRDYESTLGNEVRDLIQRSLGAFKRLLFIGCGDTFSDPNFQALVVWLRKNMRATNPQHYALVSAGEVATRHADPHWQGFVEPLSYGEDRGELPAFIERIFPTNAQRDVGKGPKRPTAASAESTDREHEKVLSAYKAFLLKDCGEMTLEGVRADMDMAQRKFNLERMFVPLSVVPPAAKGQSADEPDRGVRRQRDETSRAIPFGEVFAKNQRLALLALPGAGKSLLLKRLAVAYSDDSRRERCADGVPAMDVVPVLIRCREWREHIRLPILTLLQRMPEITGNHALADLCEALMPQLRQGRVLLLIDGLDEIHSDADRATFVEHLEAFIGEFNAIRLVVTSREAGFSLVAPGLARFCSRYRIAPLEAPAIRALCNHWHELIVGDTPESAAEASELAQQILENPALLRLADNPLLLTMILVVKHGAGRLPPDRVTLYGRAVEVLLDTWNIRGHAALNLKEAIPQLAHIALELTKAGKQTATREELLRLLESAREKMPQIRLYAQDNPDQFLERVELRSSLLIESGHVAERGRTVPFYQFRHLTFQEYLAAVAVADGHYVGYGPTDTVLTPLQPYLESPNWEEVIPMAAVLAGKRAEPLLAALIESARLAPHTPVNIVDRLRSCLVEEAQATSETISEALRYIARFGHHAHDSALIALSRGPYGQEFLQRIAEWYGQMEWETRAEVTFAVVAAGRKPLSYWTSTEGVHELERQIGGTNDEEVVLGLMTLAGLWWIDDDALGADSFAPLFLQSAQHLRSQSAAVVCIAAWVFAITYISYRSFIPSPTPAAAECLLNLWLAQSRSEVHDNVSLALSHILGIPRGTWQPSLTSQQIERLAELSAESLEADDTDFSPATIVAFHSGVWSDDEVAQRLLEMFDVVTREEEPLIARSLVELGAVGKKYLRELENKKNND